VIWWISGILVLGSLVVLGLALGGTLRRLGELNMLVRRLKLRLTDVQRSILPKVSDLQQGAAALEAQVLVAQERAAALKERHDR